MGHRFSNFKDRMRSLRTIEEIQTEIADHDNFIAANPENTHPMRMLKVALGAMRTNLSELQQAHRKRFRRRSAK